MSSQMHFLYFLKLFFIYCFESSYRPRMRDGGRFSNCALLLPNAHNRHGWATGKTGIPCEPLCECQILGLSLAPAAVIISETLDGMQRQHWVIDNSDRVSDAPSNSAMHCITVPAQKSPVLNCHCATQSFG